MLTHQTAFSANDNSSTFCSMCHRNHKRASAFSIINDKCFGTLLNVKFMQLSYMNKNLAAKK